MTNDDIAPVVTLSTSGGGGGGGGGSTSVAPLIEIVKVPSPLALPGGPALVSYTYTLRNIGSVPVTDITMVDDSCSPLALISATSIPMRDSM